MRAFALLVCAAHVAAQLDPCATMRCAYGCSNGVCSDSPGTAVCSPYTPAEKCNNGECYSASTCKCGVPSVAVRCAANPCDSATCKDGYKCEANYCGGCDYLCVKTLETKVPAPTPVECTPYSEPKGCIALAGVCYNAAKCECTKDTFSKCLVDPCTTADCKDGYECVANYCGGCNHQCVKTVAKTPEPTKNVPVTNTPTDEKCTPYSEPKMCIALAGVCYNAAKCDCTKDTLANCLVDPCTTADCKDGYKCVANYCGGCNHQCVKSSVPTKVPAPAPKKDCELPNGKLVAHGSRTAVDCNTCSCSDGKLACTKMACPPAEKCTPYSEPKMCNALAGVCYNAAKCECTTALKNGFSKCLVDPCTTADCKDGYKCVANYCGGCNHQCVKSSVPTKVPAPAPKKDCELPNGKLVAHGSRTAVDCNTCSCSDGKLACTEMACPPVEKCTPYSEPKMCNALAGVCYNAAKCECTTALKNGTFSKCLVDPCTTADCKDGYKCVANYCGGCNHQCVKSSVPTKVPAPAPKKDCELPNGKVVAHGNSSAVDCNTCSCSDGKLACTDMACPPVEKCTPYSEPKMCIALAGVCYNAAKCDCTKDTLANCLVDPCTTADCKDGYKCVANYCGGCNHQCVKSSVPTKVPAPAPKKDCELPNGKLVAHGSRTAVDCNTCSCSDGMLVCTEMACPPVEKCTPYSEPKACIALAGVCYNVATCECGNHTVTRCKMNPCDTAACKDGYECVANYCGGCNHQCVKSLQTKPPAPAPKKDCELPNGKLVAHGSSTAVDCNTCSCSDGMLACTKMACGTDPTRPPSPPVNPCTLADCRNSCTVDASGKAVCLSGTTCKADADCGANEWCRQAVHPSSNTCLEARVCTPLALDGEKCGGFTMPCFVDRCTSGLQCACSEATCDAPGTCRKPDAATKAPAPSDKCTPYSEPKPCIALAGVCYNAAKCDCTKDTFSKCLVDPCTTADCKDGYECVANYCGGCNHQCVKSLQTKPPAPAPKNDCELPNGKLVAHGSSTAVDCNTCSCSDGKLACTKMACPPAEKCTPYSEPKMCNALAGVCYNAAKCECTTALKNGFSKCLVDPCTTADCKDGYKCVANYCGGCNHQCVKSSVPTKVPAPAPKKDCELPNGKLVAHGSRTAVDCNTCSCSDGKLACTEMACPPVEKCTPYSEPKMCNALAGVCYNAAKCECTTALKNGTFSKCLVDPCTTADCKDGYKCVANYCGGCNHQCVKSSVPTKVPAPAPKKDCELPNGKLVAHGSRTAVDCNTCSCSDGKLACTKMACPPAEKCTPYSEPKMCNALAGVCYNAAKCECTTALKNGFSKCLVDPCTTADCKDGYKCVANYCGGCNHQCVKSSVPTKVPAPAPKKDCELPNGKVVAHGNSTAVDCNTCRCWDGKLACTEMACLPVPATSTYDCEWSQNTKRVWTGKQRAWCCSEQGVRCGGEADLHGKCEEAVLRGAAGAATSLSKECCSSFGLLCAAPARYNCSAPESEQQREWCCRVRSEGCTVACSADAASVRAMTEGQRDFCCKAKGVACLSSGEGEGSGKAKGNVTDGVPATQVPGQAWRSLRLSLRGAVELVVENPKGLLRRVRLALLKASPALAESPEKLVVTLLGALMAGGRVPPADREQDWAVPIPAAWNTEAHAEERDAVQQHQWAAGVAHSGARVASVQQDASTTAEEGFYVQYLVGGDSEGAVDAAVKQVDAELAATAAATTATDADGLALPLRPLGAGNEVVASSSASGTSDESSSHTWVYAVAGSLGALCMGGLVALTVYRRHHQQQEADAQFMALVGSETDMQHADTPTCYTV